MKFIPQPKSKGSLIRGIVHVYVYRSPTGCPQELRTLRVGKFAANKEIQTKTSRRDGGGEGEWRHTIVNNRSRERRKMESCRVRAPAHYTDSSWLAESSSTTASCLDGWAGFAESRRPSRQTALAVLPKSQRFPLFNFFFFRAELFLPFCTFYINFRRMNFFSMWNLSCLFI